jgi:hypothetical protein
MSMPCSAATFCMAGINVWSRKGRVGVFGVPYIDHLDVTVPKEVGVHHQPGGRIGLDPHLLRHLVEQLDRGALGHRLLQDHSHGRLLR